MEEGQANINANDFFDLLGSSFSTYRHARTPPKICIPGQRRVTHAGGDLLNGLVKAREAINQREKEKKGINLLCKHQNPHDHDYDRV